MKAAKIFLIDLNSTSSETCNLQAIIESCQNLDVQYQHEGATDSDSFICERDLLDRVSSGRPDLVLFVLSPDHLKRIDNLLQSIKFNFLDLPVVVAVDSCNPDEMFTLLKLGAADFIAPPFKRFNILPRLWRLLEQKHNKQTLAFKLKKKLGLKQLVGESDIFIEEIKKIPLVAGCDANVLISGETGTGKELCSRAIHYLSPRADKPFIPFNCGSVPIDLMENELFGHVQGAFTGASTSHSGLIHAANGGTLLLDDVDCLPLTSQAKLLRFMQEKEYRQLGSAKIRKADVRIIATTNTDLEKAVAEGKLRQDLYYRLSVIPLLMPALRKRRTDIQVLARHFLVKYTLELNKKISGFAPEALLKLMLHDWPGNVRELEYVIERAVLFTEGTVIREVDIILSHRKTKSNKLSFKEAKANVVNKFERNYIKSLLLAYQGNITRAAQAAQKDRRAFWQIVRKHNIDVRTFKPG